MTSPIAMLPRAAHPALGPTGELGYLALVRHILEHGERRTDRTGTGTLSLFGPQLRFDLREGFPLLTTKRVPFGALVRELLWFLRGSTNIHDGLTEHTKIWDPWADPDGELGPIYGFQWRRWGERRGEPGDLDESDLADLMRGGPEARRAVEEITRRRATDRGVDQIADALHQIKNNPDSRRILVSAWNVSDVPRMRLPPCHLLFQFYVSSGHLDCHLYQRSADMALGVPFNIASYALLLSMFAAETRLVPRHFIQTFGDAHVYLNHVDGLREQLAREVLPPPRLSISQRPVLEQTFEDIALEGYRHHPAIRFEVSV